MTAPAIGDGLISYSYVGAAAVIVDDNTSRGTLRLRADLRQPDGLLAAPIAIMALMSGSGIAHIHAQGAPTRADLHVFEPASDVQELLCHGRIVRAGRSQVFTESRFVDADNPNRMIALGTTNYIVTGPGEPATTHGAMEYAEPPQPWRPLPEVFGGVPRSDGGFDIPTFTDSISAGGRLHSGATLVLAEAAALGVLRQRTGQHVRTDHVSITVTSPGLNGPFTVIPEVLAIADGAGTVRVEVVDKGAADRLVSVVLVRARVWD